MNEWIPVSVRKPTEEESRKHLLITLRYDDEVYTDVADYGRNLAGKEYWATPDYYEAELFDKEKVIAWMPLPEPYKEVEHGQK